jgi:hypothetical protein
MANEPNDPIQTWQSQPAEVSSMTLQLVRRWAVDAASKRKQERLTNLLGTVLVLSLASSWGMRSGSKAERVAFFVAALWLVAGQCHAWFVQPSKRLPAEAGLNSTIEFLRGELRAQQDQLRLVWLRFIGPLFLILGVFAAPKLLAAGRRWDLLSSMAPFLVLLSLWVVLFYVIRKAKNRRLHQELQDLESLEQEAKAGPRLSNLQ